MEQVSMKFGKVDLEYKPQKADGSLDAGVHFKFDIKANKEGYSRRTGEAWAAIAEAWSTLSRFPNGARITTVASCPDDSAVASTDYDYVPYPGHAHAETHPTASPRSRACPGWTRPKSKRHEYWDACDIGATLSIVLAAASAPLASTSRRPR
jgi:hypothetical protein